jgi:prevent-host-death family protein
MRDSAMRNWPLHRAKRSLSQVIDLASTEGAQTVTRYGKPVAIVVSADEFKRLVRPKESILEFFAPLRNSGIKLRRRRD